VDQRSSATDTSLQDEPILSEQWKDERTTFGAERPSHLSGLYSGERMNTAAVEHLLPLESTFTTATEIGCGFQEIKTSVHHDRTSLPMFPLPAGKSTPCRL
jgi:hypothetical protein